VSGTFWEELKEFVRSGKAERCDFVLSEKYLPGSRKKVCLEDFLFDLRFNFLDFFFVILRCLLYDKDGLKRNAYSMTFYGKQLNENETCLD
jgi:hypothetical protein